MRVDERRGHDEPVVAAGLETRDHSVLDDDPQARVDPLAGVDDAALELERSGSCFGPPEHHATSIGSATLTGPVVRRS